MAIITANLHQLAKLDGRIVKIEAQLNYATHMYRVQLVIMMDAQDELSVYQRLQSVLNLASTQI